MADYVLFTDSSIDLSADMVRDAGIQVVPLSFTIQGETYHNYPDNRDMEPDLFYDKLRAGEIATTSSVNVGDYVEAMEPVLQAGKDILVLAFSSGLSATCSSAVVASEELRGNYPERKIFVVDSLCASMGQGLLVWLAAQQKKQGKTIEQVRDWAEEHKLNVCHYFTVNDLHYLKRGGRISATSAVVGSMLQIKPVLYVDNEGKLVNIAKARGRHASLKMLVDKMEQTITDEGKDTVFISHGDCLEDARALASVIKERIGTQTIHINNVGPVIGAHTGPGVVALFYMGTERRP